MRRPKKMKGEWNSVSLIGWVLGGQEKLTFSGKVSTRSSFSKDYHTEDGDRYKYTTPILTRVSLLRRP